MLSAPHAQLPVWQLREAVAEPRRSDTRGGEELLIIEADDLRAPPGLQIALEIGRHIDGADGIAGADRARGRGEVAGALDDAEPGRCRHLLRESARRLRSVRIDDDHPELADHRVAEHCGQHREGEQRNAEDQDQRRAVVQQPAPFAPCDQEEPGLRLSPHEGGPIRASANPGRRSCRGAAPAPCRPGRRGSRTCAGRNRRWRGWRASSHIRLWWRSV